MSTNEMEKFVTVKEASELLGLRPWWLHRAIAKGLVPSYTLATQQQVADAAIVSLNAVRRLEKEEGDPRISTILAVERALRKAGVEFLPDEGLRAAQRSRNK